MGPHGVEGPDEHRHGSHPGTTVLVVFAALIVVALVLSRVISGSDPAPEGRLAVQGESATWIIDLATLQIVPAGEEALDAVPWRVTIEDRAVSEVFYLGPGGDVDLAALPGEVFAILLTEEKALEDGRLPIALTPVWSRPEPAGYDLVILRRAAEGDAWLDLVPLPGCGLPLPIAAPDATDVLSVWCSTIEDVRLLVQFPEPNDELAADQVSLIVDSSGTLWTAVLVRDGTVTESGSLDLGEGEQVPGIAVLGGNGRTVYVGIAGENDLTAGRHRASRLAAYDRVGRTEVWSASTPVPFESLALGPDGTIYAYYSAAVGEGPHPAPALMAIDPETGAAEILIDQLKLGKARLVALHP